MIAGCADVVDTCADPGAELGRKDNFIPAASLFEVTANDLFGVAVRIRVGGVDKVDSVVEGTVKDRVCGFFVTAKFVAVVVCADANVRDLSTRAAQLYVFDSDRSSPVTDLK